MSSRSAQTPTWSEGHKAGSSAEGLSKQRPLALIRSGGAYQIVHALLERFSADVPPHIGIWVGVHKEAQRRGHRGLKLRRLEPPSDQVKRTRPRWCVKISGDDSCVGLVAGIHPPKVNTVAYLFRVPASSKRVHPIADVVRVSSLFVVTIFIYSLAKIGACTGCGFLLVGLITLVLGQPPNVVVSARLPGDDCLVLSALGAFAFSTLPWPLSRMGRWAAHLIASRRIPR